MEKHATRAFATPYICFFQSNSLVKIAFNEPRMIFTTYIPPATTKKTITISILSKTNCPMFVNILLILFPKCRHTLRRFVDICVNQRYPMLFVMADLVANVVGVVSASRLNPLWPLFD